MKILVVHNEYREAGGEEKVVEAETRLLRENGMEVRELRFRSEEVRGALAKARVAWELPHSRRAKARTARELAEFRPDVMHVHNFFPLATPAVFEAAREAKVPTVFTLHNYRILCANGLFLRDGKPCELCLPRTPLAAVKYRCYQASLVGSAAVARMIGIHRRRKTWHEMVDKFIVLTQFAQSRFVKAGLPSERFTVKPNFLFEPPAKVETNAAAKPSVLFVGRLSGEKGLATLLAAKRTGYDLHIVGDGPLAPQVQAALGPELHWHGRLETAAVYEKMRHASLVVFPSECYENFPIVLLEAMAHGKPVLVSRIGGLPEIVEEGKNGRLFTPGDSADLGSMIEKMLADKAGLLRMGAAGKEKFQAHYSAPENFRQLRAVYEGVAR